MLFGKYINKYYLKYWFLFLIGILSLVAVDFAQMYEPEYLGQIVDHLKGGGPVDTALITSICGNIMIIAGVMFAGRMIWRYTLFNASQWIESGLRKEMFLKSLVLIFIFIPFLIMKMINLV